MNHTGKATYPPGASVSDLHHTHIPKWEARLALSSYPQKKRIVSRSEDQFEAEYHKRSTANVDQEQSRLTAAEHVRRTQQEEETKQPHCVN